MDFKAILQQLLGIKTDDSVKYKNADTQKIDLGEEMHIEYELTRNGLGGFHAVNLELYNSSTGKHYPILNQQGGFLYFPGTKSGKWQDEIGKQYVLEKVNFVCRMGAFRKGKAFFMWLVQPDGRYWADEDGFGMNNDEEVWLYSWLDKNGRFTEPFSDENPEGLWGTML